jgi:serine protease inhibitor ecotin
MDALRERVSAVIQTLDKQHDIAAVEKVMRLAQGLLADCDATEGAAELRTRLVDAFDAARERVDTVSDAAEPESMEMGMPE